MNRDKPNLMKLRVALQLAELEEFAKNRAYPEITNEVINLWISEGHALKFSKHFEEQKEAVVKLYSEIGDTCCGSGRGVHRLLKDKRNW